MRDQLKLGPRDGVAQVELAAFYSAPLLCALCGLIQLRMTHKHAYTSMAKVQMPAFIGKRAVLTQYSRCKCKNMPLIGSLRTAHFEHVAARAHLRLTDDFHAH